MDKKPPFGVMAIAILCYFRAIGSWFVVVKWFTPFGGVFGYEESMPYNRITIVFPFILSLGLTVLLFFIGRDLWRGKYWSRTAAIILCIYEIARALYIIIVKPELAFISNATVIISLTVAVYLLLNRNAVKYFQRIQAD